MKDSTQKIDSETMLDLREMQIKHRARDHKHISLKKLLAKGVELLKETYK